MNQEGAKEHTPLQLLPHIVTDEVDVARVALVKLDRIVGGEPELHAVKEPA